MKAVKIEIQNNYQAFIFASVMAITCPDDNEEVYKSLCEDVQQFACGLNDLEIQRGKRKVKEILSYDDVMHALHKFIQKEND